MSRADILGLLRFFGPECIYGIRSITLAPMPGMATNRLAFGTLLVPGRIVLYAQPVSPWCVSGRLPSETATQFIRAGAAIDAAGKGIQTTVSWPAESLRDFMLFEVLMHEIGHHLIQHHTGKRTVRVVRTKEHEAFADAFARQCRARYICARTVD